MNSVTPGSGNSETVLDKFKKLVDTQLDEIKENSVWRKRLNLLGGSIIVSSMILMALIIFILFKPDIVPGNVFFIFICCCIIILLIAITSFWLLKNNIQEPWDKALVILNEIRRYETKGGQKNAENSNRTKSGIGPTEGNIEIDGQTPMPTHDDDHKVRQEK